MNDLLLLTAVALLSTSQVLQKVGATRRLAGARTPSQWIAALFSAELLAAIACIAAGTALWLAVLVRYRLSYAYPLLALSYVLVYVGATSWPELAEPATPQRTLGTLLILAGVALVSLTGERADR